MAEQASTACTQENRLIVIAAVEHAHAGERKKKRLHAFWEIKLRLH